MGGDPLDFRAGQAIAAAVAQEREQVLLRIGWAPSCRSVIGRGSTDQRATRAGMPRRPRQARSTSSAPITSCRWPVAIAAPAHRSAGAASAEAQAPSEICLASAARSFRHAWPSASPLRRLRRHALGHPDGIDRGPSNGQADRVPWKALRAMSGTRECRPVVRFAAERRQDDAHQYPLPCARMPAPHGVTEVSATGSRVSELNLPGCCRIGADQFTPAVRHSVLPADHSSGR